MAEGGSLGKFSRPKMGYHDLLVWLVEAIDLGYAVKWWGLIDPQSRHRRMRLPNRHRVVAKSGLNAIEKLKEISYVVAVGLNAPQPSALEKLVRPYLPRPHPKILISHLQ